MTKNFGFRLLRHLYAFVCFQPFHNVIQIFGFPANVTLNTYETQCTITMYEIIIV